MANPVASSPLVLKARPGLCGHFPRASLRPEGPAQGLYPQHRREAWFPQEVGACWLSGTDVSGPPWVLPSPWLAWTAILRILWTGRVLRQSLTLPIPCLPKYSPCPQDVEDGGSFPNNRSARSRLCKNSPGLGQAKVELDVGSKATVQEPRAPQLRPHPLLLWAHLWAHRGCACPAGGSAAPGGGPGLPARHRVLGGAVLSFWVPVPLSAHREKAFSGHPGPLDCCEMGAALTDVQAPSSW